MPKAESKTIAKVKNDKPAKHPDAELIEACMDFATALYGSSGAFDVDPTEDCEFASTRDTRALKRADDARSIITSYLPKTLDGLCAKAQAAQVCNKYDIQEAPSFNASVANDVVRFHRIITAAKWIKADSPEFAS